MRALSILSVSIQSRTKLFKAERTLLCATGFSTGFPTLVFGRGKQTRD
jgi:hypothetical protein